MYRIPEVAEHLAQEKFFTDGRIVCWLNTSANHRLSLFDGFVFGAAFFVHHKVDHIQAFAVGFAAR